MIMLEPITITTEELTNQRIIYVRFRRSYAEFRKLFKKLFDFATAQNLIIPDKTKVLTIYDDNPFIIDGKNQRTSVAMTISVDAEVTESGTIYESSISGKFGVRHFELSAAQYVK